MKKYIALAAFGIGIVSFAQHGPKPGKPHPKKHPIEKFQPRDFHREVRGPQRPLQPRHEQVRYDDRDYRKMEPKRSASIALQLPHDLGIQVVIR